MREPGDERPALALGRRGGARDRRARTLAGRTDAGAAGSHRAARPEAQRVHPARRRGRDGGGEAPPRPRSPRGRPRGPLHGVPVGIKDIIDVAGLPTTCHSKILIDNVASADAVCVARLRGAGAIVLGKLSTHEFAIGGPSFDLPWPPARNPWNPDHHPGGSSSGSGSGVAAGLFPMALGSDTGGSVRNPASACGIVGLKPTYGLVSRRGVFPLSFTLDHVGPLTRTVADNALMLEAIAGHDPLDPGSAAAPGRPLCRRARQRRARAAHRVYPAFPRDRPAGRPGGDAPRSKTSPAPCSRSAPRFAIYGCRRSANSAPSTG